MRFRDAVRRPDLAACAVFRKIRATRERSVRNIAKSNTREAFEELYGSADLVDEYLSGERLAFYSEIADLCASFAPRRVVDVGCGTGHLLGALVRRVPNLDEVVGVDYVSSAIERLRVEVPQALGLLASVYDLPLPQSGFDLVTCTEVLEHLDRPADALAEFVRVCAAGGRIVATVPDGEVDAWEGHVNFWSAEQFSEFLGRAGPVELRRSSGGDLIGIVSRARP